jgi:hypothetical protein
MAAPLPALGGGGGGGGGAAGGASDMLLHVPDTIKATFKALKQQRKHAWLLLRINAEKFCLEEVKTGAPGPRALQELLSALPPAAGAYIVYDLPKQNTYGGSGSQLRFFTWAPSAAPGKANVIYAAQRKALDGVFTGCIDALATSKADLEAVLGAAKAAEEEWDPDA